MDSQKVPGSNRGDIARHRHSEESETEREEHGDVWELGEFPAKPKQHAQSKKSVAGDNEVIQTVSPRRLTDAEQPMNRAVRPLVDIEQLIGCKEARAQCNEEPDETRLAPDRHATAASTDAEGRRSEPRTHEELKGGNDGDWQIVADERGGIAAQPPAKDRRKEEKGKIQNEHRTEEVARGEIGDRPRTVCRPAAR